MSFKSTAQEYLIINEEELVPDNTKIVLEPMNQFHDMEVVEKDEPHGIPLDLLMQKGLESDGPEQFLIVIDDIPGAPKGTEVPDIEVLDEEDNKEDEDKLDVQPMPKGKWDWTYKQPQEFYSWIKTRITECPNHSGYDTAGIERAIAYLQRIDDEISKAMRSDIEGVLDANIVENTRAELDSGLDKLIKRRDDIKNSKKKSKKKKADYEIEGLNKEAQKISGVNGVVITVPLLISTIARVCINGVVSAGKDLEDLFKNQCEKYSLNEREKTELRQLLDDMGFPMYYDRGHSVDDEYSPNDNTNYDWNQNFTG